MIELWYEKYRPTDIKDYIWSSDATAKKVNQWSETGLRHVIFHGPPGTGKTTLARLLVACYTDDVMFVKASVDSGIDFVRYDITDFCSTGGWDGVKAVIIDESERMTPDAQESLRNVMDTFGTTVHFIFTCNDIHRIHEALKSRAPVVEIKEINRDEFAIHLLDIAIAEGVAEETDDDIEIIESIVAQYYPDMRKSIDMLQSCSIGGHITPIVEISNDSDSQTQLLTLIIEDAPLADIRNIITNMNQTEILGFYELWANSSAQFESDEGEIIKIVAKYMYQHSFVAFPEINLLAGIVEMNQP